MKPSQDSPDFPNAFYRVSVKALYVQDGKILLAKDCSNPEVGREWEWELPGGGLDFGEAPTNGLVREIKEEMGLTVTHIEKTPTYLWSGKHGPGRGMDWYWVLIPAFRVELKDLNFIPSDECREIRFFTKDELREHKDDLSPQIHKLIDLFDPADFES